MLRLDAVIGDDGAGPDAGGTRDIRPEWSGDGGHRCVGDGDGISPRRPELSMGWVDPPMGWVGLGWVGSITAKVLKF